MKNNEPCQGQNCSHRRIWTEDPTSKGPRSYPLGYDSYRHHHQFRKTIFISKLSKYTFCIVDFFSFFKRCTSAVLSLQRWWYRCLAECRILVLGCSSGEGGSRDRTGLSCKGPLCWAELQQEPRLSPCAPWRRV